MDNTGFIYVIIVVALIIKGVIDLIWKQTAKKVEATLPPFDARQQPQVATEKPLKKKKQLKKQQSIEPIASTAEPQMPSQAATEISRPSLMNTSLPLAPDEEERNPVLIQDLDDMKKAVIFSEILNRKYN